MSWVTVEPGASGGYWKADDPHMLHVIVARAASALEVMRRYAGEGSFWSRQAEAVYSNHGVRQSTESGARALAPLLREWCSQVEAGIVEIVGSRVWAEADTASTDLMGQVRRLLEDRRTHPAMPIVLCGAVLETTLRGLVEARGLPMGHEKPSLMGYARVLRSAGLLTKQDMKDLEQCAGLRNSAAHGEFDDLSGERAGLMEQQTNLLLRRLAELQPYPDA
ncbi:hypothetical protein [Streptosporangium sp. NPDC051022]|uniref:hypothetical protein n=1 Tax=Streptosporangium sp. NPDC051022 TaxID=3155752 RepID=UPI0034142902